MAYFNKCPDMTTINIPSTEDLNGVIFYNVKITVEHAIWFVQHRYREFCELHEKLIAEQSVSKKLLPPKKIIGNRNPAFVEQRRKDLEEYLQLLLSLLRATMPRTFLQFLDFNKYDIIFLLEDLAQHICLNGMPFITENNFFTFSILELYAMSERMRLPCPTVNTLEKTYDFSHILDFCSQLQKLKIIAQKESCKSDDCNLKEIDLAIGRSSLIPRKLKFNLNAFKSLASISIKGICLDNIQDAESLKANIKCMVVNNCNVTMINEILMLDNIHKTDDVEKMSKWNCIEYLDLSSNLIGSIDHSIKLTPNVKTLILDRNRIGNIKNLNYLFALQVLSVSSNLISECIDWHLELGNVVTLNLSQNKLKSLDGLKKMYSLISLNLSFNLLQDLDQVRNIASLPLLENISLNGNPLATSVDYRARVLSYFNNRASDIYLDNEKGTDKELDTALVLSALQQ